MKTQLNMSGRTFCCHDVLFLLRFSPRGEASDLFFSHCDGGKSEVGGHWGQGITRDSPRDLRILHVHMAGGSVVEGSLSFISLVVQRWHVYHGVGV